MQVKTAKVGRMRQAPTGPSRAQAAALIRRAGSFERIVYSSIGRAIVRRPAVPGLIWMIGILFAHFVRPHTVGPDGIRIRDGLDLDAHVADDRGAFLNEVRRHI